MANPCILAGMSSPNSPRFDPSQILSQEAFHATLQEIVDARQQDADTDPLTLILGDGDNFKLVNDVYDHETGDMVIYDVRRLVTENVRVADAHVPDQRPRPYDLVAMGRTPIEMAESPQSSAYVLGGDEVGVIARTDAPGGELIVSRLRLSVAGFVADEPGSRVSTPHEVDLAAVRFGMSWGAATHEPDMSASSLKRLADAAMQVDKERQRDELFSHWTEEETEEAGLAMRVLKGRLRLSRGEVAHLYERLQIED